MHAGELDIDEDIVRRLLTSQFPQWADNPIERVNSAGTDNAIFRLGDRMAVRLPRIKKAAALIDKECQWLPVLAPQLPLPIPVPIARGTPDERFPLVWSVCSWLEGENANLQPFADPIHAATTLARFIAALQHADAAGGPPPGTHNSYRGGPLMKRDADVRAAIASLDGAFDTGPVTAAWEAACRAPAWDGPPVWIHGDLQSGNLLVADGRLSAVIDFGCLGTGDPAGDVMAGWTLFTGDAREAFRRALGPDDGTWARGRGWALCFGLVAYPYYRRTNLVLAEIARHTIGEVLADHAR
jgi:aminoglycoside phosphotransferase (APT) family kinase protein